MRTHFSPARTDAYYAFQRTRTVVLLAQLLDKHAQRKKICRGAGGGRVQEKKAVDVDKIIQKTRAVKSLREKSRSRQVAISSTRDAAEEGQNSVFMRTSALAILEPNSNQLPDPWGYEIQRRVEVCKPHSRQKFLILPS